MGNHDRLSGFVAARVEQHSSPVPQTIAIAAALLALAAIFHPVLARADERLRILMEFAGGVLAVSLRDIDPPGLRYVSDEQMQLEFYGADVVAQKDANKYSLQAISAYFDDSNGVIVLNEAVDYSLPENEHILVHELVHYLQWKHEMQNEVRCIQQLEEAAYRAQNLWILATGLGELTDKKVILFNAQCPSRRTVVPRVPG